MNKHCKIDGCNGSQKRIVKGYCLMHYRRVSLTGEPGPATRTWDQYGECTVDGCSDRAGPSGACRKHWHKVNNPNKSRNRTLARYGLTTDEYNALLTAQGGGCKLCGTDKPGKQFKNFAVDHDHRCCPGIVTCGKCVRGLLCSRCNWVLGHVNDSTELLRSMIDYLKTPTPIDHPDYTP